MDLVGIGDPVDQWEAMTAVARTADEGTWDSIWLYDHFHITVGFLYSTAQVTTSVKPWEGDSLGALPAWISLATAHTRIRWPLGRFPSRL
jgi:alkanesulfonate monooxygenase SsuD/methylene tetrahydromethanopterin reductase-like flavin-dependent oxidoreductase (luciferase family)